MTTDVARPPALGSVELAEVLAAVAADARERRAGGPPVVALDLVRRYRLGAVRLPIDDGGGGYRLRDLLALVVRLGEADPDVPHILRMHWGFVEELLVTRDGRWEAYRAVVARGDLVGGAGAERNARPVGTYVYDTTLLPDGDGFVLEGRKAYSTGAQYADFLRFTATAADGTGVSALVPAGRPGIEHLDDWDGIGQRETGSGTTLLRGVRVEASEVGAFTAPGGADRRRQPLPHLLLHAVAAGILHAVVEDAAQIVRSRPRPYAWASTDTPTKDPQLLQAVGELASAAFVAEAAVLVAAEALDRATDHVVAHGRPDPALDHAAALAAAQVKVGVEDASLRAASDLFRVGGASAVSRAQHLDRHWRNLRTLFSHHPALYKASAIGDVVVNDVPLPPVGFF